MVTYEATSEVEFYNNVTCTEEMSPHLFLLSPPHYLQNRANDLEDVSKPSQRARDIFFHSRAAAAAAVGPSFPPILSLLARLKVFVGCLKQSGMHDARPRRCHIHMCSDFEVLVEGISLQKLRLSSVHPMSLSAA